jgi:GSH-dependent disulfide-bond oxidoreductase
MTDSFDYTPPKVWTWSKENGGRFANINRPIAGPTHDKDLPVGRHPLQLYSLATPNGVKVTVMLEELLALGHSGAEYDAWLIRIGDGDQFGSGFVAVNPNSKIPALMDHSGPTPIRVFESGSILMYLAEKFGAFLPTEAGARAECLSWLFWQMGSAPYLGGGFGHFYAYAPTKIEYAIDRFAMETKRQLDVLDHRLAESEYVAGGDYTIADMAIWPWYGGLAKGWLCEAAEFRCRSTQMSSAGPTRSANDRLCSGGAWSTGSLASPQASCTSGTTLATSKRRHRTNLQPRVEQRCSPHSAFLRQKCWSATSGSRQVRALWARLGHVRFAPMSAAQASTTPIPKQT